MKNMFAKLAAAMNRMMKSAEGMSFAHEKAMNELRGSTAYAEMVDIYEIR